MERHSSVTWLSGSVTAAILTILLLLKWINGKNRSSKRRPPGPAAWPVVGNIFDLGSMPHHSLYKLRPKYGPVLWLKLGSVNTMVIQSAKAAAELFKNNDLVFSDRKVPDAWTVLDYSEGTLAFGKYGPYWRMLRKLYSTELLVNKRVNDSSDIREKCIDKMIHWIEESSKASSEVELPHFLFIMAFNLIGNLVLSRDVLDLESIDGQKFFNSMSKIMELGGTPNVADFLPILKWLDPLRIRKKMVKEMGITLNIAASFVKDRIQENNKSSTEKKDFLDILLEYENHDAKEKGPAKISDKNVNLIILEMLFGGSETTSSTIEWAMAELLRCPESMRKVTQELHRVLVVPSKKIVESDIERLPYLQAVVKETLRLHPVLPLLIPRNSVDDTNFMGYFIPKSTQVFVNVWGIGRDPDTWEDPLSFQPERFTTGSGLDIDYKGQHFELIPFGSGRRICAGMALAHRVVHLTLANLLWTFDWELHSSVTPQTMNMSERMGITLRKLEPLRAIPKKRMI